MPTKLSEDERRARAQIALRTRYGRDAEPDRRRFAQLKAGREFLEAAERLVEVLVVNRATES